MKKLLTVLVVVGLLFGLTGCKDPDPVVTPFSIVGEWDQIERFDYSTEQNTYIQDIVKRYTFNSDNTFFLFIVQDNTSTTLRTYESYCYRGTYTVNDGTVLLDWDENVKSTTNGLTWANDEPNLYFLSNEYCIRNGKLYVTEYSVVNSLEDKSDPHEHELKPADRKDSAVVGLWISSNGNYKLKFNSDLTFEFGYSSASLTGTYGSDKLYGKGDYLIFKNTEKGEKYLYIAPKKISTDYTEWQDIPEENVSDFMTSFTTKTRYTLANDVLTVFAGGGITNEYSIEYIKSSDASIQW